MACVTAKAGKATRRVPCYAPHFTNVKAEAPCLGCFSLERGHCYRRVIRLRRQPRAEQERREGTPTEFKQSC